VNIDNRRPISGTIEITRRCNFSCIHCYNNLAPNDPDALRRELNPAEYRRLFDELVEAGTLWLLFTGGEVFLRPDFMEIYRDAKDRGFLITVFTNGSGITESIAVMKYELPLKLKTVVLRENLDELWDMKGFAEDLGVDFKFDAMINPRLDGSAAPLSSRLEPINVVALDLIDDRRIEEWGRFCEHFTGPPQPEGRENRLYNCGGAVTAFSLDPYGGLGLCNFTNTPKDLFDIRKGSFQEGWESFLYAIVERKISRETKCTHCHIRALCGMCPAYGLLENQDPEMPVDFLCHVAHLRAHVLNIKIPPHGECQYCPGGRDYRELLREARELKGRTSA